MVTIEVIQSTSRNPLTLNLNVLKICIYSSDINHHIFCSATNRAATFNVSTKCKMAYAHTIPVKLLWCDSSNGFCAQHPIFYLDFNQMMSNENESSLLSWSFHERVCRINTHRPTHDAIVVYAQICISKWFQLTLTTQMFEDTNKWNKEKKKNANK